MKTTINPIRENQLIIIFLILFAVEFGLSWGIGLSLVLIFDYTSPLLLLSSILSLVGLCVFSIFYRRNLKQIQGWL